LLEDEHGITTVKSAFLRVGRELILTMVMVMVTVLDSALLDDEVMY